MSERRPIVAANWKMNGDLATLSVLAAEIRDGAGTPPVDVVVCPPFPYLIPVAATLGDFVRLGAQDVSHEPEGAFTGDVSAAMLRDVGCRYAIAGHSERRAGHAESDARVRIKAEAALAAGMTPIVCVGETLAERERDETEAVLERQLSGSLSKELLADPDGLVVAYEPVWAIGTGRTASPEQAQSAHAFIRERLAALADAATAAAVRLQYGGSVKPDNAADLFGCPDIDGGLIGGASLTSQSFLAIVHAAAS